MRYRLEVRNEAGDIETVVEESTIKRLESYLGALEQAEYGLSTKEYVLRKLDELSQKKVDDDVKKYMSKLTFSTEPGNGVTMGGSF